MKQKYKSLMNRLKIKFRKPVLYIASIIIVLVVLVIIFISPIAKYLIQKYDAKYSGREITLNWIYINPFTGYAHIDDLKIYEAKSDSIFFSADGVSVNFEMYKLLSKTIEISQLTINKPIGVIAQNEKEFNFKDLITLFSKKDTLLLKHKTPIHFNIADIKINDGIFYYRENTIPINYFIKHVNIESSGKVWDSDNMSAKVSLASGIGQGVINGNIIMNLKSLDYKLNALITKFDLSVFEQYLKEISNYGSLRANMDADIKTIGNFKNGEEIDARGFISINDFHLGKNKIEDYTSFKKLTIDVIRLNPKNKKYLLDSISLQEAYFKYERYDLLDNLQYMFGKKGAKVTDAKSKASDVNFLFQIADYVKILAKNFFKSNYEVNRVAIYKANLRYVDYKLNEKFDVSANPLYIIVDSIKRSDKWVDLSLKTHIKPYGKVSVNISINPKDSSDFNIKYHLQELPVTMFNPYLITYTSFPLDRGTVELKGNWKVSNGIIKSNNHIIVIDPRINKKQKINGSKWIPLKVIMFFVRERGNVIDYEIPIVGNLKDPKFKIKDVVLDALTNLFVKPATVVYRTEVKNVENEIETSFALNWDMRNAILPSNQEQFAEKMATYLKDHPDMKITVTPMPYLEKEKEYILFFEAKKMYYITKHHIKTEKLGADDTIAINKIPIKDSLFIHYLNKQVGKDMLFTVQAKCAKLIDSNSVNTIFEKLSIERKKTFIAYFKNENVSDRVMFTATKYEVPFNGFSYYKINYKDKWPEDLTDAYEKMFDLNNKSPRNKFKRNLRKTEHTSKK